MFNKLVCNILLLLFVYSSAFSQMNTFSWDIEQSKNGTLMYLDVPYGLSELNFLTITIAKSKNVSRPAFISLVFPSNLNRDKGVEIFFVNKLGSSLYLNSMRALFDEFDSDLYSVRFLNGYSKNGNDVFYSFLKFKYMLISFFINKKEKSLIVPLIDFQNKYSTLL